MIIIKQSVRLLLFSMYGLTESHLSPPALTDYINRVRDVRSHRLQNKSPSVLSLRPLYMYSVGTSICYICTNNNNNNNNTCTLKMTRISCTTLGGPVVAEERNGKKKLTSRHKSLRLFIISYIYIYINIFVDSPDRILFLQYIRVYNYYLIGRSYCRGVIIIMGFRLRDRREPSIMLYISIFTLPRYK